MKGADGGKVRCKANVIEDEEDDAEDSMAVESELFQEEEERGEGRMECRKEDRKTKVRK